MKGLKFVVTDDYRSGPELSSPSGCRCSEEDEADCCCNDDEIVYSVDFAAVDKGKFAVFEVALSPDNNSESRLMKLFDSKDEADTYAKIQYRRYTGDNPFIADGTLSSAYHPNGKRARIEVPEPQEEEDDDEHDFKLTPFCYDEDLHWIIIMDEKGNWTPHSLDSCAIW